MTPSFVCELCSWKRLSDGGENFPVHQAANRSTSHRIRQKFQDLKNSNAKFFKDIYSLKYIVAYKR